MNRFKKLPLILALLFLGSTFVQAQIEADPTTWSYDIKKVEGDNYLIRFHLKIKEGWHIYSLSPGGDGSLIAPSFAIKSPKTATIKGKIKEQGKVTTKTEEFIGTYRYLTDKVEYTVPVIVKENGKVAGTYRYQVCDESHCLPPFTKQFSFNITDAQANAGINSIDSTTTAMAVPADTQTKEAAAPVVAAAKVNNNQASGNDKPKEHRSNLMLIIEGILGGLFSIITPCVFAMLPMTVSFFLKRSKDKKSGIKVALQYSFAIIIIFALLGGLLTLVNNKNILYEFSTHWITNIVFFVMFLIFSFSFLGAFELSLPSKWSTLSDSKANMNSFSGIFFMALTLAIVSFSCTAPFLGGLISEISKGARVGPLFGFLGYGIGLALPFTLFAIFPQLLNALNKQGGWLNAVKVTFGFIELALAFKFLSNADLQKGWRLLDREIFIAIWVVIAIVLALYLLGKIRFSHDSEMPKNDWGLPYLTVTRTMFALASMIFAIYLLPGMWGAPLNGMGAFVPPMGTQDFVIGSGSSGTNEGNSKGNTHHYADKMKIYEPEAVKKFGLETYFDYKEALAASKKEKKPLMLDFTGITCVNCRKMETQVWSNAEVLKRFKEDFIIVSLYCDAIQVDIPVSEQFESQFLGTKVTTLGQFNSDLQASKYNSNTQPYYFFVDGNEKLLADNGYSYDPDASKFIKHLDAVKAKYKELNP
ncbi:MAG: cytochrome c biogenesis protein CcdA [Phycisphaerales bacterium]|nr:cytochrome c biogenesis protein CcdA [Phycisphaerales bacterium]